MNSFPKIQKAKLQACFDTIVNLYASSKPSLVHAAQRVTIGTPNAIIYSATDPVDRQLGTIKTKIGIVGDKEGQTLFVKWIEELYEELVTSPLAGVTKEIFLPIIELKLDDDSLIKYNKNKLWDWIWELKLDEDVDSIRLNIRGKSLTKTEIVPEYVLSNIQQAIIAFNSGRNGAALSLLSISLESALRDALIVKGYIYQRNVPSQDSYHKMKMHVHKNVDGFKVTFPDPMPIGYLDYLNGPTDPSFKEFKIKRTIWNGDWILQISSADDLLDFWSSNQINIAGRRQIGGLGVALDVARNDENIIDQSIFPLDFDNPIKAVRNNLIHLSGAAMNQPVYTISSRTLTLKEFIESKDRVFDTICSIGGLINDLYYKISNGTL